MSTAHFFTLFDLMSQVSIAIIFDFKLTYSHFAVFNLQHKPLVCLMTSGVKKPKFVSIKETLGEAKLRNGLQGWIRHDSDEGKGWMIHGSPLGGARNLFSFQCTQTRHEAYPVS
jgi:hypothetical protein